MLSSFLRIAFRVFIRNSSYTLINIFVLAIGLTFSIIIFLYANKELSYDRFHEKAQNIYRVGINARIAENELNLAITSTPLAGTMLREIPEVEEAVRVARFGAWLLRYDTIGYNEDNLIFSDEGFFRLFTFPLVKGSPDDVLKNPGSIVLSESAARKYFLPEDPVGCRLRVENDTTWYMVTGVMKDIPENSHLRFDMVGAISTYDKMLKNDSWVINYLSTYFLLKKGSTIDKVQDGLDNIVARHIIPDYQKLLNLQSRESFTENNFYRFVIQSLTDIHFDSSLADDAAPVGKYFYIWLFIILALIIMFLSCLNFISLVTAYSVNRAREVGVRKISGSGTRPLILQFLLESSLMAFLAMALALFLSEIALPAFSRYIGLHLSLGQLLNSAGIILLVILILVIGVVSGLYPAWYLSSYNPKSALRNHYEDHPDKGHFRTALTLFQLFLAVGVLTMTLIVLFQFRFLINKDRGYETDNLLVIRRPDALTTRLEEFKNQIRKYPEVLSVANATYAMGSGFPRFPYHPEDRPASGSHSISTLMVSFGFDSTYRIKMASGRFFDRNAANDTMSCILNETAVKEIGFNEPLGRSLIQLTDQHGKTIRYNIIGVVKDFNFETLENSIKPLVILFMPANYEGYLTVRLTPQNQYAAIQNIKSVWEQYTDAYPFVYYFHEESRLDYYKPVRTTARIFTLLSVVTTLMACLSLFALVTFNYTRRQREIGILKAIGAGNINIILRRAGEIVLLVLAASIVAWIGTWFLANYWLKDYANRITINVWFFIAATIAVALVSLAAAYYHTCLAARASPGTVLKYE